jgi:hypothetical protein
MDRIEPEPFGLVCPDFTDVLVARKALEGLEAAAEIVGAEKVCQMRFELLVCKSAPKGSTPTSYARQRVSAPIGG